MRVIASGVGKTTTTMSLGVGFAKAGQKVLLIDCDPQGSLTESMGYTSPDSLETTLSDLMQKAMEKIKLDDDEGILHHEENVDLIPANIELSGMESILVNREEINPELEILEILITMVDKRTKFSNGSDINIFATEIPVSVKAAETSAEGISIYKYDKRCRTVLDYLELTEEVLSFE